MKLKVEYSGLSKNYDLDVKMDKAIEDALRPFGLKRWASGFNMETGVRDLTFDDQAKEEEE